MCAGDGLSVLIGILAGTWLAEYGEGKRWPMWCVFERRAALRALDPDRPVRL
jgi:hypothetical protein